MHTKFKVGDRVKFNYSWSKKCVGVVRGILGQESIFNGWVRVTYLDNSVGINNPIEIAKINNYNYYSYSK